MSGIVEKLIPCLHDLYLFIYIFKMKQWDEEVNTWCSIKIMDVIHKVGVLNWQNKSCLLVVSIPYVQAFQTCLPLQTGFRNNLIQTCSMVKLSNIHMYNNFHSNMYVLCMWCVWLCQILLVFYCLPKVLYCDELIIQCINVFSSK